MWKVPPGFDASYQGSTSNVRMVHAVRGTAPLALSLLLDQSASLAVTDPGDRRLLAAKYLQTRVEADDQVALAAFASDSTSTGAMSLLPTQPVTIYPVENPGFTSDGRAYFPAIDALGVARRWCIAAACRGQRADCVHGGLGTGG